MIVTDSPLLVEIKQALKDDPRFDIVDDLARGHLYLCRVRTLNPYVDSFQVKRLVDGEWLFDDLAMDVEASRANKVPFPTLPIAMSPGYQRTWVKNRTEFMRVLEAVLE